MNSLQEQQVNGKPPAKTFVVAGDGTVTIAARRRGYYLATASLDVAFCLRARNRDDAEQEAEGWFEHLLGVDTGEFLIRSVVDDVDVVRMSRASATELFGPNIALLEPSPVQHCACGAERDRGRRLCGTCRLDRLPTCYRGAPRAAGSQRRTHRGITVGTGSQAVQDAMNPIVSYRTRRGKGTLALRRTSEPLRALVSATGASAQPSRIRVERVTKPS